MSVKQYLKDSYKDLAEEIYNDPLFVIPTLVFFIVIAVVIINLIVFGFIFEPFFTAIVLFVIFSIAGLVAMIYFHGKQYDEGKR